MTPVQRRSLDVLLFARAARLRRDRDVRDRAVRPTRSRSTSTTSCTREAKRLLDWENPFPPPGQPTSAVGHNLIWPPLAAFLVAPLTILPPAPPTGRSRSSVSRASWRRCGSSACATGACTACSRCGRQVIGEIRVSHLTPVLCLLLALAWRYRDTRLRAGRRGRAAPAAIKFFLWPLGVWLAAIGRARETLVAAAVAGASLLLVLPFTGLHDYFHVLIELGRTFDQDSYSPFGLLDAGGRARDRRASR